MSISEQLFERAKRVIPGGVNSPVRAFQAVGGNPRFIAHAEKEMITDVDGNTYIDYIGSWGPMILGHNHPAIKAAAMAAAEKGLSFGASCPAEVEMAELICEMVPSIELIRMVNSGTEAVMSALRVARGYTGKSKVIKFEGCYHGHSDGMLVKAGSGVMTSGVPDSAGVPEGCARDTLTAVYNDMESVRTLFSECPGEIAAVIIEPVAANMGVVAPKEGFLEELRQVCTEQGALLIFDEVITGFRLGFDGAQGYYGIEPDMTTFGKIIGAGMPVGAYGGRRDIMEMVAPVGNVYQAGTLSGNPVAMAAGLAQLHILKDHPEIYRNMNEMGEYFRNELRGIVSRSGAPCQVNGVGSLSCLFFTAEPVTDYRSAKTADVKAFGEYFRYLLSHGIYVAPSQFEAVFMSSVHTREDVDKTLSVIEDYWRK
ncbi:glutamate-1-semialdehyde 2,1-aminomutase [Qiania dongpingensis]|uniref:Glutamate-1-semialdehyde 2,1-aminomutase n=1 Tax=Qiania dongpingensis TaxID=2763669 RepID=A0A7G9G2S2_9FIRM|nr:glutamate-1-semialdehyde 2,1-aminomutase [Qiania dongpingensis]QNM05104.1 glutamate-1-semialdehyde 2,1-aminomutase [Qiania dongpingensis]